MCVSAGVWCVRRVCAYVCACVHVCVCMCVKSTACTAGGCMRAWREARGGDVCVYAYVNIYVYVSFLSD